MFERRPYSVTRRWALFAALTSTVMLHGCGKSSGGSPAPPAHAGSDECECAPAKGLDACASLAKAAPADQVLERGDSLVGNRVAVRGRVIKELSDTEESAKNCDRNAQLHVLAYKIGDGVFAKKVSQLPESETKLEDVPMCKYAILLDPDVISCTPAACCPLGEDEEIVAKGRLERNECGFLIAKPELCTP